MNRTNIYLEDRQVEMLDVLARQEGVSRAEVIRRLLDRTLTGRNVDLESDLAIIDDSFGALAADGTWAERAPAEREAHLARLWESV
ncbi:MAG: CopG family transcriptional regulator [Dermatophilaceae bacterium]